MKKRILSLILCFLMAFSLFACSETKITEERLVASYCVQINNSFQIDISGLEIYGKPIFHSENTKIVEVSSEGKVKGKSLKGNPVTYVYCVNDGIKYKWEIFVVEDAERNGKAAYENE